jgi:hypothetical protein
MVLTITILDLAEKVENWILGLRCSSKSAACSLQIVGVCMHIQSRADGDDVNGMMAMVLIAMMIVLVIVNLVPVALNQVDSVCQHSCKTFQQLIDFHRPNVLLGKLNSS